MKKPLIVGIIAVIFVLGAWFFYITEKYTPDMYLKETNGTSVTVNTKTGEEQAGATKYTQDEVAKHNTKESCYTTVNTYVYDLTAWVNLHPGGKEAILSICGINGTDTFMKVHKGGKKFMDILSRYKIGVIG